MSDQTIWWNQHRKKAEVTSERIIQFNRYLQRGFGIDTASRAVNWNPLTGYEIKKLIWGNRTAKNIYQFVLENKL